MIQGVVNLRLCILYVICCLCGALRCLPLLLHQALTRWGGALLELAHFRQGHEAYDMIEQAGHRPTVDGPINNLFVDCAPKACG